MKYLITALLLGLLSACSDKAERISLPALRLAPAAFAGSVSLSQRLTVMPLPATEAQSSKTLDALLEIDADQLQLAGFALGQRVLTLQWDGKILQSKRHPLLPAAVDEQRILRDVQLVYWPATAIQAALPPEWRLDDDDNSRTLSLGDQAMIRITYAAKPRWAGLADLHNTAEHYRLVIDSKETAP
ncbi:DUF3261 domain-containing protein [Iodobacter sp. CM08]|uniref:DUF3261 domain-containing protein n=1 Tax=Iodobacter sp. CM08 TaxID=3085902 RepID=UPI00298279DB|nr:DUF3261 domain-containing protein [Iodobacter sp. CM08]MDW5416446.1 DUF3261 domain-containing protein [Iodobacter sp. CM08]